MSTSIQNPQLTILFKPKNSNLRSKTMAVNRVSINDFFQKKGIDIRIPHKHKMFWMERRMSEKQKCLDNLSISKLKELERKNCRNIQNYRSIKVDKNSEQKVINNHLDKTFRQLEKNSLNNTVKYEVSEIRKTFPTRKSSTSYRKTRNEKQVADQQQFNVGLKYPKQLFFKTAPSFDLYRQEHRNESQNSKDWSVYILKRKIPTQNYSPKVETSGIRVKTKDAISIKKRVQTQSNEKFQRITGWNDEQEEAL